MTMDKYLAMYKEDITECVRESYASDTTFQKGFQFFADMDDYWDYQINTTNGLV